MIELENKIVYLDRESQYDELLDTGTTTLDSGTVVDYSELDTYYYPIEGNEVIVISLTGTSGVLTDAQIAKVIENPSAVVLSLGGRKYIHNEDAISYVSYSNVVYPTTTTKETKVIYINVSSEAVNYKHWNVEDQEESAGAGIVIETESTTTIEGYAVPELTADQIVEIYNGIAAGSSVIITDPTGNYHFEVDQADNMSGVISIDYKFFNVMFLTYSLENDDVTISSQMIDSATWGKISGTLSNQSDLNSALAGKEDTISDLATIRSGATAGSTALQSADVVNNVTSSVTNKPLSANMGKELQDQIAYLKARGRYLSGWNCSTGLAVTTPISPLPYVYHAGDYFIVAVVDDTNYVPSGAQYTGTASTTTTLDEVHVNDTYYYDGSNWSLLASGGQVNATWGSIGGTLSSQTDLVNALAAKLNAADPVATGSFSLNRKASTTIGTNSFAEGSNTTASGNYSHAENEGTIASGEDSHAEGYQSEASGVCSHAEGMAHASGDGSHAEGMSNATGYAAHSEGYSTTASGRYSHTEGATTTASGEDSHAEGIGTTASGTYSHAEGNGTTANRRSQHVFGEYNVSDTSGTTTTRGNYIEIVGKGASAGSRSNARTLDWSGNEVLAGTSQAKKFIGGIEYLTTAPTANNTDGLKFVLLTAEPGTYYNGYYYIITEE